MSSSSNLNSYLNLNLKFGPPWVSIHMCEATLRNGPFLWELPALVLTVAKQSRYILHNISDYFLVNSDNCHFLS